MAEQPLPTGTVTFLLPTSKGHEAVGVDPEPMRISLARHDVLMRNAISRSGGHVFKTIGDAFCAAFATAPEAVFRQPCWPGRGH